MFDFFKEAYYISNDFDVEKMKSEKKVQKESYERVFLPRFVKKICTFINLCTLFVCGINLIQNIFGETSWMSIIYILVAGIALVAQVLIVIRTIKTEICGAVLSFILVMGVILL